MTGDSSCADNKTSSVCLFPTWDIRFPQVAAGKANEETSNISREFHPL